MLLLNKSRHVKIAQTSTAQKKKKNICRSPTNRKPAIHQDGQIIRVKKDEVDLGKLAADAVIISADVMETPS